MARATVHPRGISEKNRRHLTSLHRNLTGPFTVAEAADTLSFTTGRTHRFLAHLAEGGWLVRVRRGLYATVPLTTIYPGDWPQNTWIVASKLFGPDYYMGGWSACEHWSLTEQIFLDTMVFTTRKVRSKMAEIQGLRYRVRRTPKRKIFGTTYDWRDRIRVNVSDPSRTIVDVLEEPSIGGGIRHVADIVGEYFSYEHRDDELLADYARRVGNGVVFKRLGYLVEKLDVPAPALLRACEAGISSGVSLLNPSMPDDGPVAWRWNLRINGNVLTERSFS